MQGGSAYVAQTLRRLGWGAPIHHRLGLQLGPGRLQRASRRAMWRRPETGPRCSAWMQTKRSAAARRRDRKSAHKPRRARARPAALPPPLPRRARRPPSPPESEISPGVVGYGQLGTALSLCVGGHIQCQKYPRAELSVCIWAQLVPGPRSAVNSVYVAHRRRQNSSHTFILRELL